MVAIPQNFNILQQVVLIT